MTSRYGHRIVGILAKSYDGRAIRVRYDDESTAWLFTWDCVIRDDERDWYQAQLEQAESVTL